MPNFSVESWAAFKQQFVSVIQFVVYIFDMFFDTCRSNPMLYAFFFFPIFALAFILIFDFLTRIVPDSRLDFIKKFGVVSGAKLSVKSFNNSMNDSSRLNSLAAKKLIKDSSTHSNIINSVNSRSLYSSGLIAADNKSLFSSPVSTNGSATLGSLVKDSLERKEKAEQEEKKRIEKEDRDFNMTTDITYMRDEFGNPVTLVEKYNDRTGEQVYSHLTTKYTDYPD